MIKLHATISKKQPLPGTEFSSHQVSASVETEVADAELPNVRRQLDGLFALANDAVDAQLASAAAPAAGGNGNGHRLPPRSTGAAGNGHRNGRAFKPATASQQRVIRVIADEKDLDIAEALREFGAGSVEQLSVGDASALIDQLKAHRRSRSRQ